MKALVIAMFVIAAATKPQPSVLSRLEALRQDGKAVPLCSVVVIGSEKAYVCESHAHEATLVTTDWFSAQCIVVSGVGSGPGGISAYCAEYAPTRSTYGWSAGYVQEPGPPRIAQPSKVVR